MTEKDRQEDEDQMYRLDGAPTWETELEDLDSDDSDWNQEEVEDSLQTLDRFFGRDERKVEKKAPSFISCSNFARLKLDLPCKLLKLYSCYGNKDFA